MTEEEGATSPGTVRLAVLLLAVLAVALGLSFGLCLQDDAFISFRYAGNLAAGHGLVYNPGEAVEGYTNFLWTLCIGGWMALGFDPVMPTIGMGLLGSAGLVVGAAALGRPRAGLAAVLVAPALVASDAGLALEAVQGLESSAYAAVVTAGVWARVQQSQGKLGLPLSGLLCGIAALTRPEGYLVFALVEGLPLLAAGPRAAVRRWPDLAVFTALVLPHLVFRLVTYGQLLPNTFYAKVGGSTAQVLRGVDYVTDFATAHLVLCSLALLGALALLRTRRGDARTWLLVGLPAVYLAYVTVVGGDFKLTWRFILPVLGLLAVLAQEGALVIGARLARPGLVAALAVVAALGVDLARLYPAASAAAEGRATDLAHGTLMGSWLRASVPADTVLAIHAAGIVPYTSGLPTIDMWGLSDPHIARRRIDGMGRGPAGHEKTDYDYVFARDPDLYLPHQGYVTTEPVQLLIPRDFPADFEQRWQQFSIRVGPEQVLNLYAPTDRPLPWAP